MGDATAAIAEMGYTGAQGEHMVVVENTPEVHNLVVCTLCSCYPWPVLGLPPVWYKSSAYRSRAVIEPRGVLNEFGLSVPDDVAVRVWDSDGRDLLPRPARASRRDRRHGCRGIGGAGDARCDGRCSQRGRPGREGGRMNGVHDMGGMHGFGPVEPEANEPVFHALGKGGCWRCDVPRAPGDAGTSMRVATASNGCRQPTICA